MRYGAEYGAVINFWCNIVRHFKEGAIGCGKHAVGAAPHPPHLKFGPGYKVVYDKAPGYLKQLIQMEIASTDSQRTRARPAEDTLRMQLPKLIKNKASERRFSVHAPDAWNSLPLKIRSITSIDSFKGMLKNHLFNSIQSP